PGGVGVTLRVSVQPPWPAGISDGGELARSAVSPAATRNANSGRPCCLQDATTVSTRSANRLPASLSAPKLPLRHSTAGRKARSAPLLVGSSPSTCANVHIAGHHFSCFRTNAA